jgi:hypothetical protein
VSRLAAALVALVAIACFLIEAASQEAPLDSDECLHAGTPTECAQAHNHR